MFCGSGGVGKTTTAAAAAVAAAAELGGRVLVLTIDPARRLADALGLEALGNVERRVPDEALRATGLEPRGELFAAMLDTKASWDDLVLRHAPDEETTYRVLGNSLYQNITARFVQSHDYIAMERLYDLRHQRALRPDRRGHAPDPQRHRLPRGAQPDGGVLRRSAAALADRPVPADRAARRPDGERRQPALLPAGRPGGRQPVAAGHRRVLLELSRACTTGSWPGPSRSSGSCTTGAPPFAVVTTLEGAPLREAELFVHELGARHLPLGGALVLNRVLPPYRPPAEGHQAAATLAEHPADVAKALVGVGDAAFDDPERTARVLATAAGDVPDYSVVAGRGSGSYAPSSARVPDVLATVSALPDEVHDLAGLARIGRALLATTVTWPHGGRAL